MQLKRIFTVLILAAAFLAVLPLSALGTSGQADNASQPAAAETLGPNLLTNPGMDGKYVKQCSARNGQPWVQVPCPADYTAQMGDIMQWETTQVPYGWSAWWQPPNDNFDDPNFFNTFPASCPERNSTPFDCRAWHNPEYRDTLGGPQETGPERTVAGDNSQKYFTFYSVHDAGLYQVVGGVKPGNLLRFSVFIEAWSTSSQDPFHSDLGQRMNLQVGIDPTGGNNPWSPKIIWTAPAESFDRFTQFTIDAVAKNNVVSVWTKSKPNMPLQHVDVYVDEASLNVVQGAKAAPKPASRPTRVITTTKVITGANGITSTVVTTRTVVVTPVPATRIVTSTKVITSASGITSTVLTTRTVVVTPVPVTRIVTSTKVITSASGITSTVVVSKSVPVATPAASTKPVSGTVGATTPVTGTLPIPASGTYTVVKGDSLSKIARRFGVSLATLIALNNIADPNRIEAGMVLKLK
jgi:LysM repeat protein